MSAQRCFSTPQQQTNSQAKGERIRFCAPRHARGKGTPRGRKRPSQPPSPCTSRQSCAPRPPQRSADAENANGGTVDTKKRMRAPPRTDSPSVKLRQFTCSAIAALLGCKPLQNWLPDNAVLERELDSPPSRARSAAAAPPPYVNCKAPTATFCRVQRISPQHVLVSQ